MSCMGRRGSGAGIDASTLGALVSYQAPCCGRLRAAQL